jgi:radical SAM protein with 4Fe4S-binding SPASM domain
MGLLRKTLRELSFRTGSGYAPLPASVTIEVNYDCNFRCPSCALWTKEFKSSRIGERKKLSLAELQQILSRLAALGVQHVHFGGGEPLVRKDFLDIVASAKACGMETSVFTNGYLINEKIARRIVQCGLDRLNVSIDGPNPEVNDRARGVSGAFERTVNGIRILLAQQRELGSTTPDIALHCTVSAGNFSSIPDLVDLAQSLGVRTIRFQYASVVSQETKERTNRMMGETVIDAHTFADLPDGVLLGDGQLENLESVVAEAKKRAGSGLRCELDVAFEKGDREVLKQGKFPVSACDLPWRSAIISPIGDVLPCSMYTEYRLGNVQETPFERIWNGQRARKMRRRLSEAVPPLCQTCCVVHEDVPPLWRRVYSKVFPDRRSAA